MTRKTAEKEKKENNIVEETIDVLPQDTAPLAPDPLTLEQLSPALGQRFETLRQELLQVNQRIAYSIKNIADSKRVLDRDEGRAIELSSSMNELQIIFNSINPKQEN